MEIVAFVFGMLSEYAFGGIAINANFVSGSGGIAVASIGNISRGIFVALLIIVAMYAVLVSLRETEGSGVAIVISAFLRGGLVVLIGGAILAYVAA